MLSELQKVNAIEANYLTYYFGVHELKAPTTNVL